MERFWRGLANVLTTKRWTVVGVMVVITAVLAIGLTRVEFATGQDSYLNPSSQIALDNVEFQSSFGGEQVILLFTADEPGVDVSQLFEGDNLAELTASHVRIALRKPIRHASHSRSQTDNLVVRCAVELALLDAYGRAFGVPLSEATRLLAPDLVPRSFYPAVLRHWAAWDL